MLVLSREVNQTVVIETSDGLIEVTILGIEDNSRKVRVGFQAPRTIQIDRKELFEAKKSQNEESGNVNPDSLDRFRS